MGNINIKNLNVKNIAIKARQASKKIASIASGTKNVILLRVANLIEQKKEEIINQNKLDLKNARELLSENKISQSIFNRLLLTEEKIFAITAGIKNVASLPDPVNKILWGMELDDGLELYRVSSPIGVIGVIFESRPDVIPQIASLAIKSSNVVILKGGKEAENTNRVLFELINTVLIDSGLYPENTINLIYERDDVNTMLKMDTEIDLIIPRGSNKLVKFIKQNTSIPVLGHSDGVCHIYFDEFINLEKALSILIDSKCSYPSACNSVETLLVHKTTAREYLPKIVEKLFENNVEIFGCKRSQSIVPSIYAMKDDNWNKEYSELKISLKIVENIESAIEHINTYGSGHTDTIVTESNENALLFMNYIDSAGVYSNASTRFADGFRYGFGAEVGISTNKIHVRGPVGLEGLVTYKYKLFGNGHISSEFSGKSGKVFKHKLLAVD